MKNLPLLPLKKIFEKIDFINLIKLRLICRDWKQIIDSFKIKELMIEDKKYRNKIENVISLDQFKLDSHNMFKKIISSNILSDIKYLNYNFNCNWNEKNKLIHLNCFQLLENLVLKIDLEEDHQDLILVHTNLKYLSVLLYSGYVNINIDHFYMEINCPKCEKLKIYGDFSLSNYDVIYPDRINILKLSINDFHDEENSYNDLDKFKNIERLEFELDYCFPSNNQISSKIKNFSKLKKIAIKYDCPKLDFECDAEVAKNIRDFLNELIDLDLFSKKQTKIFLNDKKIKSKEQIKKLIDKEIGCSLDFLIWQLENDSDEFDGLMDWSNSTDDDD